MKKLYIIVDAFLDRSQQTVQSGHAIAQFFLQHRALAEEWNNGNIVIKKSRNMEEWAPQADASFREPYWENKLTSVAAYRNDGFAKELPLI